MAEQRGSLGIRAWAGLWFFGGCVVLVVLLTLHLVPLSSPLLGQAQLDKGELGLCSRSQLLVKGKHLAGIALLPWSCRESIKNPPERQQFTGSCQGVPGCRFYPWPWRGAKREVAASEWEGIWGWDLHRFPFICERAGLTQAGASSQNWSWVSKHLPHSGHSLPLFAGLSQRGHLNETSRARSDGTLLAQLPRGAHERGGEAISALRLLGR